METIEGCLGLSGKEELYSVVDRVEQVFQQVGHSRRFMEILVSSKQVLGIWMEQMGLTGFTSSSTNR